MAVIPLSGVIGSFGPRRRGLSLEALAPVIARAFKVGGLKAVALSINSPGGSPVQSSLIQRRIRALAEEKKVPLQRWAQPVEYAYAVAFLASAESDFITGQVVSPNGGEAIVGI